MSNDNAPTGHEKDTAPWATSIGNVTVRITHSFPLGGNAQWVTAGVEDLTPLPEETLEDTFARAREIAIDAVFEVTDEFTERARARTAARRREAAGS